MQSFQLHEHLLSSNQLGFKSRFSHAISICGHLEVFPLQIPIQRHHIHFRLKRGIGMPSQKAHLATDATSVWFATDHNHYKNLNELVI